MNTLMTEGAEKNPDWKALEILVAKIQQELSPDAQVSHNVKVEGRETGELRQIDVLVRQKIGQYEMMIAIDCKDYKVPVDVKGVEQFHGLLEDVGAHKGALVCPKGFSHTAKKRAKRYNIDLYSPVDTDPHKWQVKPALPMICDFRSAGLALGIRCSEPMPFQMEGDFFNVAKVYDGNGIELGTTLHTTLRRWNSGEFPTEPGEHNDVLVFGDGETLVDNGYGQRIRVTLTVSLHVKQRLYFGYLPITKMRGLRDEQTGLVVTNAFTTGVLNANQVESGWKKLDGREQPPVKPVLTVWGLDCWEEEHPSPSF